MSRRGAEGARSTRWRLPRPALASVAAAVLLLAGCARDPSALRLPAGTPVVLLSIDTLRADRLPAYGYRGVETPAIDALRREAILFRHAYTPTPLTLPAHASLLSGVLPEVHGVRDNVGYRLDPARQRAGEVPQLPALLRETGYATAGAVSAYVLQGRSGLAAGFELYADDVEFVTGRGLGGLQRPGGETLARVLPWLRETAAAERPFLLFLHLYEPHTPYAPPEPFASRYATAPYDGEIAAADAVVGALVAELKRLGRWDAALVVLLSDHGEGLGDHGEDEHGVLLYREAIQVPLLLKLPGGRHAGGTAEAPVSLVDVAPTVAALLGLPAQPAWRRPTLLAAFAGAAPAPPVYAETFYPRLHFGWSDLASVVDGRHHLIVGPQAELYDLRDDPGERRDLVAGERRTYAALRRALDDHDRRLQPPAAVDEESRRAMAALGYVGSVSAPGEGPLPDPRRHLGELRDLQQGFAALGRGDPTAAAERFRSVIAASPGMVDAWEFLGHAEERRGRHAEALAAYREALARSGGSPHVAMAAAALLLQTGDLAGAEQHARLALAAHPSFAHGLLAQVALRRRDLDAAEREAELAVESGDRIGPTLVLAEVLHARQRYEEAMALTDRALAAWEARSARDPELLRGAHLLRGRIFADLGRAAAAERELRRELALFPGEPRAYSHLALLLALAGRGAEVAPLLRELVERHPSPEAYLEAVETLRVLGLPEPARRLLARGRALYPGDRRLATAG